MTKRKPRKENGSHPEKYVQMPDSERTASNRLESLRGFFNNTSSCVAVYEARSGGEDFAFVDLNEAAQRVEHVRREDVLGKSVLDVFPGVKEFGLFEVFQRVWRTGEPEHYGLSLYSDERTQGWKTNYVYKLPSGDIVAIYDDVTERKQVEERLWIMDRAVESTANAIAMADLAGNLVFVNSAFLRMWGYEDRNEILGRPSLEFSREKEGASAILEALSHGDTWVGEMTATRKDGSQFEILVSASMIRDEAGRPLRMLGVFVDVSEQKKAEERTRWVSRFPSENPNPVLRIASDGTLLFANEASGALLAARGCQVDRPVPADIWSLVQEALAGGIQTAEMQVGDSVFLEMFSPVASEGYVNVYAADITQRKQAEIALRESEQKYRSVVENASEAILIAQDGYVKFANPATASLIERPSEYVLAHAFVEFIHPEDQAMVVERYRRRIAGEKIEIGYKFRVVTGKGSVRWVHLNAARIEWQGRPATINFLTDVTESKETEERLKQSQEATIRSLAMVTERRDPYTAGHQTRVGELACAIASELGLPEDRIDGLRVAATLHDIGKVSVPTEILSKPTKLTEVEFSLVKEHPQAAYEILKGAEFPWPIADIILQHHERLDGSGYPSGLSGDEICLEARLLAVADTVEAMASHRPYRPALGIDKALEEIAENSGRLYDSSATGACIRLFVEERFHFAEDANVWRSHA